MAVKTPQMFFTPSSEAAELSVAPNSPLCEKKMLENTVNSLKKPTEIKAVEEECFCVVNKRQDAGIKSRI